MIVGMVAAKAHSRRLPGKNWLAVDREPMFWHAVKPMLDCPLVDRVCVGTDSEHIARHCEHAGVAVVWREAMAALPSEGLVDVYRYMYRHLRERPEMVVGIMANCPGHTADSVTAIIELMRSKPCLWEARSFNSAGVESGIHALRPHLLEGNRDLSVYMGAMTSDVNEVHSPEDYEKLLRGVKMYPEQVRSYP